MALVDDLSSFHDRTEHTSNQSTCSSQHRRSPSELDDNQSESKTLDDKLDDEDDDDDARSDYLMDSLLNRNIRPSLGTVNGGLRGIGPGGPGGPGGRYDDLGRTYSNRSLTMDDDRSWNTLSSVHSSRTDLDDDRGWKTPDSVHTSTTANAMDMPDGGNGSSGAADYNDSTCSFASFNDSDDSLDNETGDLSLQRAAFTRLSEDPTPRSMLMKSQSLRMSRGISFRGSGLALIEETTSLD